MEIAVMSKQVHALVCKAGLVTTHTDNLLKEWKLKHLIQDLILGVGNFLPKLISSRNGPEIV